MPRLRNIATGVVVNVSDETAANLSGYEPVEAKPLKPAPAKKAAGPAKKAAGPAKK